MEVEQISLAGSGTDFAADPSILYQKTFGLNNSGLNYSQGTEYYIRITAVYSDGASASPISYANSSVIPFVNINLIKSNEVENVVSITENKITKTATFDKINKDLTIQRENEEPFILVISELADASLIQEDYIGNIEYVLSLSENGSIDEVQNLIESRVAKTTENTFSNYEYTITHSSPEKWEIRKPKGSSLISKEAKKVTYNSSTKGNLNSFKSQVDKINSLEWQIFGGALSATGLSILTLVLSLPNAGGSTLTSAALGVYGATATKVLSLHTAMKNARIYYYRL
ncbi:geobacillin-26 family protein [Gottfriedia acidiceleris]|uniref:geobacillin-26 family protein n=1 Tax=Gottfriedia acidiceleris TaxID=371036 RepID=UPI002FFF48C6